MTINTKRLLPIIFTLLFSGSICAQNNRTMPGTTVGESFAGDVSYQFLQKLIDTAKKYYPEVKIKAAQAGIAKTSYHQAKAAWFDAISITPSYIYNPGNSINLFNTTGSSTTFFNGYQIAFSISLGSLISKPYLTHNAKQNLEVYELQQQEYNLSIEAQVKHLYFGYLQAAASLRLLTHAVQDAQINVEQVKHRYEEVSTTLTEYNTALTQLTTQNVGKLTAELAFYNAKVSLEEILGKRLEDIK